EEEQHTDKLTNWDKIPKTETSSVFAIPEVLEVNDNQTKCQVKSMTSDSFLSILDSSHVDPTKHSVGEERAANPCADPAILFKFDALCSEFEDSFTDTQVISQRNIETGVKEDNKENAAFPENRPQAADELVDVFDLFLIKRQKPQEKAIEGNKVLEEM